MLGPRLRYGIPLAAAVAVAALVGLAFSQTGSGWCDRRRARVARVPAHRCCRHALIAGGVVDCAAARNSC